MDGAAVWRAAALARPVRVRAVLPPVPCEAIYSIAPLRDSTELCNAWLRDLYLL
jgi:hypothetical protein